MTRRSIITKTLYYSTTTIAAAAAVSLSTFLLLLVLSRACVVILDRRPTARRLEPEQATLAFCVTVTSYIGT